MMKRIQRVFDRYRSLFEEGGKLEKFFPIFEATETFFFIPAHVSAKSPHVRDSLDVKRFMSLVIIGLLPPFLFGIYNAGYQSCLIAGQHLNLLSVIGRGLFIVLPIVFVSYTVGFFWEFVFAVIRKHPVSEGLLVTGLIFPLTLPPTIPLWQVAIGISFGVVFGKEIFGGTGRNFLNPALTGRAFIFFAYPAQMSGDHVWIAASHLKTGVVDAVSGATPLAIAALAEAFQDIETVLLYSGYAFSKLFWGNYPGSLGGTSTLMCLIGGLFLILTGVASYRIIIGGIIGALLSGLLLNWLATPDAPAVYSLNPLYHLAMGGFAFGIVYMATDPVSAPGIEAMKWIYGFFIGSLTVVIRIFNPAFPEGIMLAILFMNLFAPLLDYFAIKMKQKKRIPNAE